MAGIGKTTLANKIYKDDGIHRHFVHCAWAFVSKDCVLGDVFISILQQLSDMPDSIYKETNTQLAKRVNDCLLQKTYFIVLDDVWSTSTLKKLLVAFPKNKMHSRILLTTQIRCVAEYITVHRPPHDLKLLTPDESLELLEKKVFGKAKCPQDLKSLGVTIAEKCGGLPLAIVVIAGILLQNKFLHNWWEEVAESVNELIVEDERMFLEVVARSYNNLPQNLKSPFLYFGLIPRGPIHVRKLVQLWLAEGFISHNTKSTDETYGARLLDDLVGRNLVLITSLKSNSRIKSCTVHDTLRTFCIEEAERRNLFRQIDMFKVGSFGNYCCICVDAKALQCITSETSGELVCTFLSFNSNPTERINLEPKEAAKIFKVFKRLKILEVSCIVFTRFPKELRQLLHFRFLAFSCHLKSIPASISSFLFLETLILLTSSRTLEVRDDIWKLSQLRHLQTNASANLLPPTPDKEKGKENMQSLSYISPESCTVDVFSRTPCLKKLGIRGNVCPLLEDGSKLMDNVLSLERLVNLKIRNALRCFVGVQRISRKFPTNLKKLTLVRTSISWDKMYILGDLLFLEVLKLKENAFRGKVWKPKPASFGCLRTLFIERTNFEKWDGSDKQYPLLVRLVLKDCIELQAVPLCLADATRFQELEIYSCSKPVVDSSRELQMKMSEQGQVNRSTKSLKLAVYPLDM